MSGHVMVFAPAPQLTVTVEEQGGEPDIHLHAGGQGVWQSRMIMSLGMPVVMCTTLGGETGRVLEPLLVAEGVELRVAPGESRNGAYIHDRRGRDRVDIADAPGEPLGRHELDELYGLALAEGQLFELVRLMPVHKGSDGPRSAVTTPDELAARVRPQ